MSASESTTCSACVIWQENQPRSKCSAPIIGAKSTAVACSQGTLCALPQVSFPTSFSKTKHKPVQESQQQHRLTITEPFSDAFVSGTVAADVLLISGSCVVNEGEMASTFFKLHRVSVGILTRCLRRSDTDWRECAAVQVPAIS